MLKRPSNHFLSFTRKERKGIVFFLFIICLMWATPFFYSLIFKADELNALQFTHELDSLKTMQTDSGTNSNNPWKENTEKFADRAAVKSHYADEITPTLFYFDPNTLGASGWKKLGLREKTITGLQHYIEKGGRFRQPMDIKKIWGLPAGLADKLLPYVRIESAPGKKFIPDNSVETKAFTRKSTQILNINRADSLALVSLPGIGPGYTRRILKFREKLGGFYSIDQVSETFGLPDSVFQKIKTNLIVDGNDIIRKVNINTAGMDELKEHPYIRYQLANSIIQFRSQHGNFVDVAGIKKIMMVTDELYNKVSPYLTIQ